MEVHSSTADGSCPVCDAGSPHVYEFRNSDEFLKEETARVLEQRKSKGLEGLVGGLECVVINTEPDRQKAAAEELLRYTGLDFAGAFQDRSMRTCVLKRPDSADFLVTARMRGGNPFAEVNAFPKSHHLPNTRIETLVFGTPDIRGYVAIQKERGINFITEDILRSDNYSFIQTIPSSFTGNSLGFIEWHGERGYYKSAGSESLDWEIPKPDRAHLRNIGKLDHAATRVEAVDRDAAIIEFMHLTNYHFDFAIYVKPLNSITNVARLSAEDFAMVFTSGISPYVSDEASGPTEKFIHNYGQRVHHLAFTTEHIEETFAALKGDSMEFLIDLVGSPEEGLKQTFTMPSEHTLLVNEYIHRFGGFDGFFTKSNVTLLTGATDRQ